MDNESQNYSRIAYYLAKSTACYMDAVIAVDSGKGPEQRLELNDNEIYVANILLIIAANQLSMDFQQNPSVVHLLALEEFWKGIYSDEQTRVLQNVMNDKFNRLLVSDKDILETIGNIFSALGQDNDAKLVEELVGIYHLWVKNLGISKDDMEPTFAMLARPFADHTRS